MYTVVITDGTERLYVGKKTPVKRWANRLQFPIPEKARIAARRAKKRMPAARVSVFRGMQRMETY